MAIPSIIVTPPQRPSVSVVAQGRPVVASVATYGPQGLSAYQLWLQAGNTGTVDDFLASLVSKVPGPPGANGYTGRYGTIDYSDNDAVTYDANGQSIGGTALNLPAGQWVRVMRNLTPSPANFNLPAGPFAGFSFRDNTAGVLRARAIGDVYLFKFSFTVIPQQRGGGLRFSVRPGVAPGDANLDFGPEPIVLTSDAGQPQAGSETFYEQVRTKFGNSGALIYLMATSGATLTEFSPEVTPIDPAPGST